MKKYIFILIFLLVFFNFPSKTTETVIDLVKLAKEARWYNDAGVHLIFPGRLTARKGFVRYMFRRLEDGQVHRWSLATHPRWVPNGWIEGEFEVTLPRRPRFEAEVGFVEGARQTDGVVFEVYWQEGDRRYRLAQLRKNYEGQLKAIQVDLSDYGGHKGKIFLRVKAGANSDQDWAVWAKAVIVSARPLGITPPRLMKKPAITRRIKPIKPQMKPIQPQIATPVTRINISKIPVSFHRRAVNFLNLMARTQLGPILRSVRLGDYVHAFYRPDLSTIAYYEFEINPQGYLFLSTGEHDSPVTTWSYYGRRISQRLREIAHEKGKEVAKFYCLGDVTYAAEDEEGQLVAYIGAPLVKPVDFNPAWLEEDCPFNDALFVPSRHDDLISGGVYVNEIYQIKFESWGSWRELKEGFSEVYRPFINEQRLAAHQEWIIARQEEKKPHPIVLGMSTEIPLLYPQVKVEVDSPIADYLDIRLLKKARKKSYLEITPPTIIPQGGDEFSLRLTYANGQQERLKFKLESALPLSPSPKFVSVFGNPGDSITAEYWAGSDQQDALDNQPDYSQVKVGCDNLSACGWSGCGSTAWAILFGWADRQAAFGNPVWRGHWGIYRQDVEDEKSEDAVPPLSMDDGVIKMTKKISKHLDPICVHPKKGACLQGATAPRKMIKAAKYIRPRETKSWIMKTMWACPGKQKGKRVSNVTKKVKEIIKSLKTPVVIGIGHWAWELHYPVAFGYIETNGKKQFYINLGYGGKREDYFKFVSAKSWFFGAFYPLFETVKFKRGDGFVVSDLDGDGQFEIIHASRNDTLAVYNDTGQELSKFDIDFERFDGLASGDVDGDGVVELVQGDRDDKIVMYKIVGGRILQIRKFDIPDYKAYKSRGTDYFGDRLAVGNLDDDPPEEIVHASRDDKITIYNYRGRPENEFGIDFKRGDGLAVGDVNGDGVEEIIIGDRDDRIIILDKNGQRLGSFGIDYEVGDELTCGDIDGDGQDEIIHADRDDRINIYFIQERSGPTDLVFDPDKTLTIFIDVEREDGLAVGDVDGDGETEIILGDRDDRVVILDKNGNFKFIF